MVECRTQNPAGTATGFESRIRLRSELALPTSFFLKQGTRSVLGDAVNSRTPSAHIKGWERAGGWSNLVPQLGRKTICRVRGIWAGHPTYFKSRSRQVDYGVSSRRWRSEAVTLVRLALGGHSRNVANHPVVNPPRAACCVSAVTLPRVAEPGSRPPMAVARLMPCMCVAFIYLGSLPGACL